LLLAAAARHDFWSRLAQRIGTPGVDAYNDVLAVACTPSR